MAICGKIKLLTYVFSEQALTDRAQASCLNERDPKRVNYPGGRGAGAKTKDGAHRYIKFPSLYCRNRVNSS